MAKLKDLIKEHATLGGVVSRNAFSNLDMGFKTQKTTNLTDIVEDVYGQSTQKVNVNEFLGEVGNFNSFGNEIYREGNLRELAEKLSRLAETAKQHTLQETEDWFDKITVNRNMKELTGLSKQFGKIAQESNALQQRMSGLYEDMGHVLSRYFEIDDNGDSQEDEKIKAGLEEPKGHDIEEGDYKAFFQKAMKKFGISSPDELDDDKKKEFFNYVDANYKGEKETD